MELFILGLLVTFGFLFVSPGKVPTVIWGNCTPVARRAGAGHAGRKLFEEPIDLSSPTGQVLPRLVQVMSLLGLLLARGLVV